MPVAEAAGNGRELRRHPVWESRVTVVVALLLIPGLLAGAYAGGTDLYYRGAPAGNGNPWSNYILTEGTPVSADGYSNANTETTQEIQIDDRNLLNVTFTLVWTDEPDTTRLLRTWENQPDNFGLDVSSPDGQNASAPMTPNVHGQPGEISCTLSFAVRMPGPATGQGPFNVTVKCGACGMSTNRLSPIGYTDAGNAWTLMIEYSFYNIKK
jgi:hypothetical protein